ncbi:MAG: energy-coupling factor transporter transmembrane component T family protein [Fidelibacterota bacterium]
MRLNPLTLLWCAIWGSLFLLRLDSLATVTVIALALSGYLLHTRNQNPAILSNVKPFLFLLPVWMTIYGIFSLAFSQFTWIELLSNSALISLRFIILILTMSWLLSRINSGDIIRAGRTLWVRTGLSWPRVDDAFLFIELILRFFPQFIREWQSLKRARQSVGLAVSGSRTVVLRRTLNDLPGLFLRVYSQADTTARMMVQRGYGQRHPRAVIHEIPWRTSDTVLACAIPLAILGFRIGNAL